ncbi:MAG: Hsp20/alpha crystallin family protein [Vicinamibacteria bacterium]|nr:Hsp20/alpha crystallin family protein [Vicinamibacteria bacterium]
MSLVRFDPFRELTMAQNRINHVLADAFTGGGTDAFDFLPAVDIRTGADHSLIIEADLPGISKDAISVNVENRTLTIKGERRREVVEDDKVGGLHRAERAFGTFVRAFTLPGSADASKVKADYKDGVLTVTVPVAEQAKPRSIEIKVV